MDEHAIKEKVSQDVLASCAMHAVLATQGVAEMAPVPGVAAIGKDKDSARGIRIAETRKGLSVDVYLNVLFGAKIPECAWNIQENVKHRLQEKTTQTVVEVNIHIMGVSANDPAKGNA